jgi:hypothetical protein
MHCHQSAGLSGYYVPAWQPAGAAADDAAAGQPQLLLLRPLLLHHPHHCCWLPLSWLQAYAQG